MAISQRLYIFLPLVLGFLSFELQAENTIKVVDPADYLIIGKNIKYFEDPQGKLSIDEVIEADEQGRFLPHQHEVFSRPGTKSAFWFKIAIQNHTKEDAWLEAGSNYAWYIDFYAPDSLGNYSNKIETGTMRPEENKLYDVNYFWLPLNHVGNKQTKTYYLRVVSGLTFELPLHVGTIRSLNKNKAINDYLTAGFIGIVLIMLMYNLFIYISTKDHIYIYYLGYLFVMMLSIPYANGYPFVEKIDFLFINKETVNNYFLVWHATAYFFAGMFCIKYLNLKERNHILYRIIQFEILILVVVFPLLNIIGFQFVELVNTVQISILAFYLTCLIAGYYLAYQRVKQAYFYALGWSFLVISAFIFFALINGYIPFNPFTRNVLYLGVAIEVCLFALALANRLNELRNEKEIIEEENFRLVTTENKRLEEKVKIRTQELESTNEDLKHTNEELLLTTEKLDAQSRELIEVNHTKDRLFAIVSHDLRSPISSLKGILDLMYKGRISKEEFLKFSIDAKQRVEQAHFMLNNLLTWAKFQLQGMSTKPDEIDLRALVDENLDLFRDSAKKKNIMVLNKVSDNIKIFADPNHINLVIRNLLSNAIKFTETGEKVIFETRIEDDLCVLKISDTGIGIPEDKLSDIFTLKPGKSNVGTEGEKGTGLGLPLCKDFVEKNNGSIEVESKLNSGTTFYVKLPLFVHHIIA